MRVMEDFMEVIAVNRRGNNGREKELTSQVSRDVFDKFVTRLKQSSINGNSKNASN